LCTWRLSPACEWRVSIEQDGPGKSSVVIYMPDNGHSAPIEETLRPEDLLHDYHSKHL